MQEILVKSQVTSGDKGSDNLACGHVVEVAKIFLVFPGHKKN